MTRILTLAALLVVACAPLARGEVPPGQQVAPSQVKVIVMAWIDRWLCENSDDLLDGLDCAREWQCEESADGSSEDDCSRGATVVDPPRTRPRPVVVVQPGK
jgi:hypothetical protein